MRFTLAEVTLEATAGQIFVVPTGMMYKLKSTSVGRFRRINIHLAARMETE